MQDKHTWKAIYNDGTTLSQIDSDGTKHPYSDINRADLAFFQILQGESVILSIPFLPGDNLVWRRRVETQGQAPIEIVHIVGKQTVLNGENRQVVFAVYNSDSHIEISDKWDSEHPWFFPVQINTHEGESE